MNKQSYLVKVQFTEPVLGSANNNKDVHAEYIASKAQTATDAKEEVDAITNPQVEIEKTKTVFPRDSAGSPHVWDYQVRGFFKEAISVLIELGECKISKWGYKKAVDSFLFVAPRRIYLLDTGGKRPKSVDSLQRPLRAQTMQGERIALANSEMLPEGTRFQFTVTLLSGSNPKTKLAIIDEETLRAALEYGALKGFGQWRSGGYGRFTYDIEEVK
jgi:hypothetical protein